MKITILLKAMGIAASIVLSFALAIGTLIGSLLLLHFLLGETVGFLIWAALFVFTFLSLLIYLGMTEDNED